ncbi:hypothetical protein SLS62_003338 [Diatrype stigma]|uniref:FAD-binding PCMH-type domain-containing protein n=1 Tax=Diatrype stigma TaxID=117547 RepID=A0AAN9V761_9PEZI
MYHNLSKAYPRTAMALTFVGVAGLAVAVAAAAASAGINADADPDDTCELVAAQTDIKILSPLTLEYNEEQTEYWSTACGALMPSCILAPSTTDEVAAIMATLLGTDELFAVKSGGHNPNNGWASVADGPLISTMNLNEVIFDPKTETVRVGPGNRWDEVAAALDGTGYTAVGGRIGNVGVGGYLLGGGLSFQSLNHGWAANSVLEYTLVLPNATVVAVQEANHPDLFLALKGGGNNFGIVTSFLLKAYPQGDVWGGNLWFEENEKTTPAVLQAIRDFTEYNTDPKAGIIVTSERTLATLVQLWIVFLFYDGPDPPEEVFKNFTDVKPFLNTCKTQTMSELVSGNNWAVLKGNVYQIGTETVPLPSSADGAEIMSAFFDTWANASDGAALIPGTIASIAFQPAPKGLARAARRQGGDLLDLDDDLDRLVLELNYSFTYNSSYAEVDDVMRDTYGGLREVVQNYTEAGRLPADAYLPLFANDAFYAQDYWARLRPESAVLARRVAQDVDPDGVFRTRTGGWKP